jgi:hypothetical protein
MSSRYNCATVTASGSCAAAASAAAGATASACGLRRAGSLHASGAGGGPVASRLRESVGRLVCLDYHVGFALQTVEQGDVAVCP